MNNVLYLFTRLQTDFFLHFNFLKDNSTNTFKSFYHYETNNMLFYNVLLNMCDGDKVPEYVILQ